MTTATDDRTADSPGQIAPVFMPSDEQHPLIEVGLFDDVAPPFVCGVRGRITGRSIEEIEEALIEVRSESDVFSRGFGLYLFRVKWIAQDDCNAGYWDFTFNGFRSA